MKRKCMMATVVLTLMMTAVSGCGNEKGGSDSAAFSAENEAAEDKAAESRTDESGVIWMKRRAPDRMRPKTAERQKVMEREAVIQQTQM